MKIHQLQVTYQVEEDRVLIRLNTTTGNEFRLSLTRRMVKNLFPHILRVSKQMEASPIQAPSHDGTTIKALAQFKKQELLQLSDFKTPFSNQASTFPIGEVPLLATTVHLTHHVNGSLQIGFEDNVTNKNGSRGFQVTLDESLLVGFINLLESALQQADWGILPVGIDPVTPDQHEDAFASAEPTKYLN
jgi:hypothetical protein